MAPKIDEAVMMRMYKDGKNTAEIARFFGVTWQGVKKMKDRMETRLSKVTDLQKIEYGQDNIDVVHQLKSMNDHILTELKRCQRLITREDDAVLRRERLEDEVRCNPQNTELVKKLKELAGDGFTNVLKIQDNLIKISGEVRKQIELEVKIAETLFNIQMVADFQKEVIEILRVADPALKDLVLQKLKQRHAVRNLVRLDK